MHEYDTIALSIWFNFKMLLFDLYIFDREQLLGVLNTLIS